MRLFLIINFFVINSNSFLFNKNIFYDKRHKLNSIRYENYDSKNYLNSLNKTNENQNLGIGLFFNNNDRSTLLSMGY